MIKGLLKEKCANTQLNKKTKGEATSLILE
jgi:hypothetical protein